MKPPENKNGTSNNRKESIELKLQIDSIVAKPARFVYLEKKGLVARNRVQLLFYMQKYKIKTFYVALESDEASLSKSALSLLKILHSQFQWFMSAGFF